MMPTADLTRKDRFRNALRRAGLSQREWREQVGVSKPHLWQVLTGNRQPSPRIAQAIDDFIAQHDPAA
jgi:transcriptional regulator with XRE-family HTH domain